MTHLGRTKRGPSRPPTAIRLGRTERTKLRFFRWVLEFACAFCARKRGPSHAQPIVSPTLTAILDPAALSGPSGPSCLAPGDRSEAKGTRGSRRKRYSSPVRGVLSQGAPAGAGAPKASSTPRSRVGLRKAPLRGYHMDMPQYRGLHPRLLSGGPPGLHLRAARYTQACRPGLCTTGPPALQPPNHPLASAAAPW